MFCVHVVMLNGGDVAAVLGAWVVGAAVVGGAMVVCEKISHELP